MRTTTRRAFTLIEILIAIGIVAMAFVPILNMYTGSMRDSLRLSEYAHARELAAKTMDELLAMEYEDLPEGSAITRPDGYKLPRTETKRSTEFKISVLISDRKPEFSVRHVNLAGFVGPPQRIRSPDAELKNIEVRVEWMGVGSAQSFTLQALKADLYR